MTARPKARRGTPPPPEEIYVLRLYVAGTSERSARAIRNAKQICDEHLSGRYELEVIDVFQQIGRARDDQVIAIPTLIKKLPTPLKRFIGDLSDRNVVVVGLDVKRK
ncbi:MAG TPA: circadian clock KaiB family protein [Kofleriaceae bacterium]|nr:circadian clock KaiB family protein [Kofleriaceae bacterium]